MKSKQNIISYLLGAIALGIILVAVYFASQNGRPQSVAKFDLGENTQSPDAKTYTSENLGVSFNYFGGTYSSGDTIKVQEMGNKIYVYGSRSKNHTADQWLEVFSKNKQESLTETIQKRFLQGYSPKDCFVITNDTDGYERAMITVPKSMSDDLSTLIPKWQKCPQPYGDGSHAYFLMDKNHPDKFLYFQGGQYPIMSGIENKAWNETIKIL